MIWRYVIPGCPVTKKNSQRIARRGARSFILPSARFGEYEAAAAYFLQPRPPAPISTPVICRYTYWMQTRRRVDLSNLEEATDDILVTFGILSDDNRNVIAGHDGSRVYYDKLNPRVEIEISPVPPEEHYEQWLARKPRKRKENHAELP